MWVNALSANSNYSGMIASTVKYYNTDRSRMVWQFSVDSKYYISAEPYPVVMLDGAPATRQAFTNHMDYVWKAGSLYLFQYYGTHTDTYMICNVICGYDFNDTAAHPYWRKSGANMFGTYTRVPAGGVDKVVSYSVAGLPVSATLTGVYSGGTVVGWKTMSEGNGVLVNNWPTFVRFKDTLPQRNGDRYFHANSPLDASLRLWWSPSLFKYVVVHDVTGGFIDPPPVGTSYWKDLVGLVGLYTFELNGDPSPPAFTGALNIAHLGYDSALQRCSDPKWHYGHAGGMVASTLTSVSQRSLNYR